jgi:hypothetical protein
MSLLRKMRTLVGALVHKPFMPRPEKVGLEEGSDLQQGAETLQGHSALEAGEPEVADRERVADLIAEQQRDEAD